MDTLHTVFMDVLLVTLLKDSGGIQKRVANGDCRVDQADEQFAAVRFTSYRHGKALGHSDCF